MRTTAFAGPNGERGGAGLVLIASLCRIASYARRNRLVREKPGHLTAAHASLISRSR